MTAGSLVTVSGVSLVEAVVVLRHPSVGGQGVRTFVDIVLVVVVAGVGIGTGFRCRSCAYASWNG